MEWAEHRTFLLIGEFDVTTSLYVQIPLFKKNQSRFLYYLYYVFSYVIYRKQC